MTIPQPTSQPTSQPTQQRPRPGRSARDVLAGVGAFLALLTLVVGVPLALAVFIGWPLPRAVPTLETLQNPITPEVLQRILAVFVWLAWAQFTACVIVEAKAEISGVGLPAKVPGIWGSQLLARQLVAAVLLLVTSAGTFAPGLSSIGPGDGPGPQRPVTAVASAQAQAQPDRAGPLTRATAPRPGTAREPAPAAAAERSGPAGATAAAPGHGQKVYTVQPPQGRHHESLWEIAERHLGDGRRYREIYELNKGREQPDGDRLHIARLIRPGWVLVMPPDAVGCEIIHPRPATPVPPRDVPADRGDQGEPADHAKHADPGQQADHADQADQADPADQAPDSPARVPYELAAATLLAAGLLAALGRRRRRQLWHRAFGRRVHAPDGDAVRAEEAIRLGADPGGARLLDLGLRELSSTLAERGRSLPNVYAARLSEAGLDLMLSPPDRNAPAPWIAADGGTVWRLPAAATTDLDADRLRGVLAPYPGLVSLGTVALGTDASARTFVDLEAAGGVIGLVGPAEQSRAVLAAVATELATNRWSDHMRITLVGFGTELPLLAPERVRAVPALAEVLPELEERAAETQRALAATGLDSVLTGRCRGIAGEAWMPHFLIVAHQPEPADAARLARVAAASARTPAGFLVAGEVPGQSWTWRVSGSGRLQVPLLGLDLEAQQLPEPQYRAVVDLFRAAGDLRGDPFDDTPPGAPAPSVEELQRPAPVTLRILGPIEADAPGQLEEGRAAACTEMLVYLTMHREGVHPTVLGGAIWPRGVSAAVRDATVARVRDWLGRDSDGKPNILLGGDGRLRPGPGVHTDWDGFTVLLRLAAEAEPAEAAEYLEAALALVRGPLLADRPPSRYAWLAGEHLEYEVPARIADAAQWLAAVRTAEGDPDGAVAAIRAGLRGAPDDEELWRSLLRAAAETGDKAQLRGAVAELQARAERDAERDRAPAELHPQTEALIDELLPSWRLSVAT